MKRMIELLVTGGAGLLLVIGVAGCGPESRAESSDEIHVSAADPVTAGRYLVTIGQCNDCHTEGFLQTEGKIPEEDWLAGSTLGWRGPWGTTYPPNLRLRVQEWTEDEFVTVLHTRKALPPMPWMNVNKLSDRDARAIYRYIRSLGPKGSPMPVAVPADREPSTPYLSMVPQGIQVAQQPLNQKQ